MNVNNWFKWFGFEQSTAISNHSTLDFTLHCGKQRIVLPGDASWKRLCSSSVPPDDDDDDDNVKRITEQMGTACVRDLIGSQECELLCASNCILFLFFFVVWLCQHLLFNVGSKGNKERKKFEGKQKSERFVLNDFSSIQQFGYGTVSIYSSQITQHRYHVSFVDKNFCFITSAYSKCFDAVGWATGRASGL